MDWQRFVFYFIFGGSVVSLVTYLGTQGHTFWASFAASFPAITVITFLTVFRETGSGPTLTYAKGLLYLLPAWVAYVSCVIWLLPRKGIGLALLIGVGIYIASAMLIRRVIS